MVGWRLPEYEPRILCLISRSGSRLRVAALRSRSPGARHGWFLRFRGPSLVGYALWALPDGFVIGVYVMEMATKVLFIIEGLAAGTVGTYCRPLHIIDVRL